MKIEDEAEGLVGLAGMTPEQFAAQTAVIRGGDDLPIEDEIPGSIVMRADYDNVRNALATQSEDFAALTDANKSIADALLAVTNGARICVRKWSVEPRDLQIEATCLTDSTMKITVTA